MFYTTVREHFRVTVELNRERVKRVRLKFHMLKKIDIFISHSWREHEEWLSLVNVLDSIDNLTWRNFSVPWHDPALHPSREPDCSIIEKTYKTQIIPCDISILIIDLFKSKGGARWAEKAMQYSKEYDKPIYGIKFDGELTLPQIEASCDECYEMSTENIRRIIDNHSKDALFKYI